MSIHFLSLVPVSTGAARSHSLRRDAGPGLLGPLLRLQELWLADLAGRYRCHADRRLRLTPRILAARARRRRLLAAAVAVVVHLAAVHVQQVRNCNNQNSNY